MINQTIISAKKKILEASFIAKEGHLASAFSVIDLIYVLIKKEFIFEKKKYLNNFILSKGHACLAYYALLNEFNLINDKTFYSFCNYKSILGGHPDRNKSPDAQEHFKEISEAYAVLSDGSKRKLYDNHGHAGVDGQYSSEDIFRGADFSSIFGNMGGGLGDIFENLFSDRTN